MTRTHILLDYRCIPNIANTEDYPYVPVAQKDMGSSHLKVIWIFLIREIFIAEWGILGLKSVM